MEHFYIAAEYARLITGYHGTNFDSVSVSRSQIPDESASPFECVSIVALEPYLTALDSSRSGGSVAWKTAQYCANNSREMLSYSLAHTRDLKSISATTRQFINLVTNIASISHVYNKDGTIDVCMQLRAPANRHTRLLFQICIAIGGMYFLRYAGISDKNVLPILKSSNFNDGLKIFGELMGLSWVRYVDDTLTARYTKKMAQSLNPNSDALLTSILNRELESKLGQIENIQSLSDRANVYVQGNLGNHPAFDDVCDFLCQSRRTLSRQLKNEGTSFKQILNEARKNKASALIDTPLPVKKIAALSGFKSVSSFNTYFKEWFGTSPSDYRRSPPRDH